MFRALVVPLSSGAPLGRKRTVNHDLPPRMTRKRGRYYYVSNGQRQWIPLGPDLPAAKSKWAELEQDPRGLSVGDLLLRYISRGTFADGTVKQYRSYQKALALEFDFAAKSLTSQHLALWRDAPEQRCRKGYINGCLALVRAATALGEEQGLCSALTVRSWPMPPRDKDLTADEFRAIWNHAPEWLRIAMELDYLTAARRGDVIDLKWSSVGESVAIRQQKTQQRQAFTLSPELEGVLARARSRRVVGLYVVANDKGKHISKSTLQRYWSIARKAAGVDAQFRDIRAMAAKAAKEGGQDYQALLGHTSKRMSDRYIKGRETVLAEPVRKKL